MARHSVHYSYGLALLSHDFPSLYVLSLLRPLPRRLSLTRAAVLLRREYSGSFNLRPQPASTITSSRGSTVPEGSAFRQVGLNPKHQPDQPLAGACCSVSTARRFRSCHLPLLLQDPLHIAAIVHRPFFEFHVLLVPKYRSGLKNSPSPTHATWRLTAAPRALIYFLMFSRISLMTRRNLYSFILCTWHHVGAG